MAKTTPCISVGMPVYNGETFLREALDSLCAQSFTDFELIISDNASTDQTQEICREYAGRDPRIRYERLDSNQGAVENFNRLVGLARGEYFKWAAADDICLPNFLEATHRALEAEPDVVWTQSEFGKIDQHGNVLAAEDAAAEGLANSSSAGFPRRDHASPQRHRRFRGVLLGTTWCGDIYGLIRKSVLERTNPLPTCFGAEKVLIGELALWGPYREIPQTLFYQRVHASTAGNMATRAQQEQYVAPQSSTRKFSSSRLALLRGHLQSIRNVPMSRRDRVRCFGVIGEYLLQISKWNHVLQSEILRRPLRRTVVPKDRSRAPMQASSRKLSRQQP